MGPDFASETCFTCCEKPLHFHKLSDSDEDSNPNIRYIIGLHFWFKEDDLRNAIVCDVCWKKVDQFHQFYEGVKMLDEHRKVVPLAMFIKQEEIVTEETQLQENDMHISAENQKLFDTVDCKFVITEVCEEQPMNEEPSEVIPQPKRKTNHARRLPNRRSLKRKNPHARKHLTPEEMQAEDDFIKQHTRYICDECNVKFESFQAIKNHRMKAHSKNTVVCCGNHHRTRSLLYQHVMSLLNPEAFKCEICGNTFKSKYNYVRHKEMYHAAEEDLIFKCNRCPKSFIKEGLLKTHLAEHETLEKETAKCEFCGKCFRNKGSLNKHVKEAHEKPMDFICEVCSKGFYCRAKFLEHHKTHELTAEQLKEQCPVCNKWFKSHTNWLQHVQRHKGGECTCEVCGHVSSNMLSLKRHMKNMHAPDKKSYACEQCGSEYAQAITLKEHIASAHTREPLYQCQYCEMKFFWSATRNSHRRKDHPQEWLEERMSRFTRKE